MTALGRTPPHSQDAEESLLACCLIDGGDSISACIEAKIASESFFDTTLGLLFEVLSGSHQAGHPVDRVICAEEIRKRGLADRIGGAVRLDRIGTRIPTTAHRAYFIAQVRECQVLRELIGVMNQTVEGCSQNRGGIAEFVDKVERDFFQVTQNRSTGDGIRHLKEPMREATGIVARMLENNGALTGIPSGLRELDQMLFGFQKQEMIVLAARPSMGKTSLALNIIEAAALPKSADRQPAAVLLFSLEMGSRQIALRMIFAHARVNMQRLRETKEGPSEDELSRIGHSAELLRDAPILVDDTSSITVMELRTKARRAAQRLRNRGGLKLIVVDYLQLLSGSDPAAHREQQVAEISRGLKGMAKELRVPVIVLSQLNRASEKDNRPPRLSDLRESGSIEQDADVVMILARPPEADPKFQTAADTADLVIAKQRNGPVGTVRLSFLRNITRFENYSPDWTLPEPSPVPRVKTPTTVVQQSIAFPG